MDWVRAHLRHAGQLVLALLAVALTARYALSTWRRRDPWDVVYPYKNGVLTDFRDTVMLPWEAIRGGVNPYDISLHHKLFPFAQEFDPYAPWWLSATHPFALFSWDTATLLYSVVTAVAISALAFVAGWWAAERLREDHGALGVSRSTLAWGMVVAAWLWRPTTIGHGLGNVGAVAALCAALSLMARQRNTGAVLLALAWVKPQFGIPVVLVMAARGQGGRAALGTGIAAFASIPITIRLARIAGGPVELVQSVLRSVGELGQRTGGEPMTGRVDVAQLLTQLHLPANSMVLMGLGMVLAMGAGRGERRLARAGHPGLGLLLACLVVLLCFPHLHYDLPMLLPAAAWSALETWGAVRRGRDSVACLIASLAASAILASVCLMPRGPFAVSLTLLQSEMLIVALCACLVALATSRPISLERSARAEVAS